MDISLEKSHYILQKAPQAECILVCETDWAGDVQENLNFDFPLWKLVTYSR